MNLEAFLKNLQAFSNFLMTRRILAEIQTPKTDRVKKALHNHVGVLLLKG